MNPKSLPDATTGFNHPTPAPDRNSEFLRELTALINKHSMENQSNTPDFVLAKYLVGCLDNFAIATAGRDSLLASRKNVGVH